MRGQVELVILDVVGLRDLAVRADQVTDSPRYPRFEIFLTLLATGVICAAHRLVGIGQEWVGEAFTLCELLLVRD